MDYSRRQVLCGVSAWSVIPFHKLDLVEKAFPALKLVRAARAQIGVTRSYDGSYQALSYPGGDVSQSTGVCIDVVIRALRTAFGFDLQKHIHDDMRANFNAYPNLWGLSRPDQNIDHRRVPNLETYLSRHGYEREPSNWAAGDIVSMRLASSGLPHVVVLSDQRGRDGLPLAIHNIGRGAREEPVLGRFEDERRFRVLPDIS